MRRSPPNPWRFCQNVHIERVPGWCTGRTLEQPGNRMTTTMLSRSGERRLHKPPSCSLYLCQGRKQIPQHFPIFFRALSACFISLLMVSRPSSIWSSCSTNITTSIKYYLYSQNTRFEEWPCQYRGRRFDKGEVSIKRLYLD